MIYELAAGTTALVHLLFILFVIFGAVLGRRSARWKWMHLGCMAYGVLIEIFYWYCPLTYVEQYLRGKSGKGSYSDSFIEHYVYKLIYVDVAQWVLIAAAIAVLMVNAALYVYWWRHALHRRARG